MTEKAAGADATGMQTRAEKQGNDTHILNGEKWFLRLRRLRTLPW